jgi:hypothetical protein
MKKFVFLPLAALAFAACIDTSTPLSPVGDAVGTKQGAAKQGTNANITFAQMQQNTDWTTSRLGANNAAFAVNDQVNFRWVREAAPNVPQTMTITWDAGYGGLAAYGYSDGQPVTFSSSNDLCNGGAGTSLFCEQGDDMPTQMAGAVAVWGAGDGSVSSDCTATPGSCVVPFTPAVVQNRSWNGGSGPVGTTQQLRTSGLNTWG